MVLIKLNHLVGLILAICILSCSSSNLFKQPNFHLEFHSCYVDDSQTTRLYSLTVNQLLPIVKMVSTKFSKIYIHHSIDPHSRSEYDQNAIPEAVALHNQQNPQNKIEIIMTVFRNSISSSKFNQALVVANKANSIFNGSVTYLSAEIHEFRGTETVLGDQKIPGYYKLAVMITLDSCDVRRMARVIKKVNLLILNLGKGELLTNKGVEQDVEEMKLKYETCRKKIQQHFGSESPEIGLQIRWSLNSRVSKTGLFHIWLKVNNWSIENNVKIFIQSAFDDKWTTQAGNFVGRWKLVSNDKENIYFEDNFGRMDEEIIKERSNSTSYRKGIDYQTGLSMILVLGTALAFIVGLILFIGYRQYLWRTGKLRLTRKEVREFYKGTDVCQEGEKNDMSSIEGSAYNKEFEIAKDHFKLSDEPLGSGAFGEVWKGTVIKDGVEVDVAAKTLKKGCPTTTIKGFLSEIKVMGYLGQHENLVGMVGAYTKGLERGKVIVFTELCERGSLESYLRNLGKNLACENKVVSEIDLNWFGRWSFEIANGMEYLSSKNVVHADLATRNVLLNDKLIAKISDFGLSRRLYDYTNYVKTQQQEPLPWKWLAPESLQRLEFNEKTDVWAFGVTMWEIYSLGNIPYPGLNWTVDFPTQLINGLRMEKPLNDDGMYIIMIKCWNVDPSKRPSFSQLKSDIKIKKLKVVHASKNSYKNAFDITKRYQNNLVV